MFACTDFTMVLVTRMYDALHCNEYYGSLNPTCPAGLSGFLSERTDHGMSEAWRYGRASQLFFLISSLIELI